MLPSHFGNGYDPAMEFSRQCLILLLLVGVMGCHQERGSEEVPYFYDLIADWDGPEGGVGEPVVTTCLDSTRKGLQLKPGAHFLRDLQQATGGGAQGVELEIEACSVLHDVGTKLELRWTAGLGGESVAKQSLALPAKGTARATLPLPAGGTCLEIRVPKSSQTSVFMQEASIKGTMRPSLMTQKQPSEKAPKPAQILFISVDTLREDAIESLGSGGSGTPRLDALVAESQVWSPHYAAATWTQPSHATLLTGLPTSLHGVEKPGDIIHSGVITLAERMSSAGLLTAARVHDCVWLDPKFGFKRGFDDFKARSFGLSKMVREVANWMSDHQDEPFFFFFHNYEPHSDFSFLPYEAPGVTKLDVEQSSGLANFGCREGVCASALLQKIERGEIEPLAGELEAMSSLYHQGVSYTDEQLGVLFEHLKALGMWDRLMIVLTSDHGESFEAAGRAMHGGPWEEILRVPLIIKWPQGEFAGERRDMATSSADLAPTFLAAVGVDARDLPGTDLRIKRRATPIFAGTLEKVVVNEGWKGVFRSGKPARLYDLDQDPGELNNLAETNPEERERLSTLLEDWKGSLKPQIEARDRRAQAASISLTPEETQRLKSLGYLGGG